MKRILFWSTPILVLAAAVAVFMLPPDNANSNIIGDLLSGPESSSSEPIVIGEGNASVIIEEYASLSCPHCAKFHNEILPELLETHIKTGKAKLLWHSYVRNEPDLRGTMLLQCLEGNKRKSSFVKVLFRMQDRWAFEENFQAALMDIARTGGMSEAEFNACMADTELEIAVLGVRKSISDSGRVKHTPTFYINGKEVSGARSTAEFAKLIDEQIPKSINPVTAPAAEQTAPESGRRPINQ